MEIFGDVISTQDNFVDISFLKSVLSLPGIKPLFKIVVLHPDETENYEIPSEDIPSDGISYSEEYKNGARRSLTLKLINYKDSDSEALKIRGGKYTPSVKGLWLNSKFAFYVGLRVRQKELWFPKGVFVMGDSDTIERGSEHLVTIQLKDKFTIFEGNSGVVQEAYEIPVDNDIYQVIKDLLSTPNGDGYIKDYKNVIFSPELVGKRTQATIRLEAGSTMGEVIDALATQLSAEYYYNSVGNLCFYPTNEASNDSDKPVVWVYDRKGLGISNISMSHKNDSVVNVVKVVGDNITQGVSYAIVENHNPASPTCIEQIGYRKAKNINDSNIWSNELALDLANYNLRKSSFVGVDFSCTTPFNPILVVNNIFELENDFLEFQREKILITGISYSSPYGILNLRACSTKELPQ